MFNPSQKHLDAYLRGARYLIKAITSPALKQQALNLRMLLDHLGFGDPRPTDIYVDNKGAITMGLHPANKPATRHVNMRMHAIRKGADPHPWPGAWPMRFSSKVQSRPSFVGLGAVANQSKSNRMKIARLASEGGEEERGTGCFAITLSSAMFALPFAPLLTW